MVRAARADDLSVTTSYLRSENLTFEEAERRIDEIAKVIQLSAPLLVLIIYLFKDLARGNLRSKGKAIVELRRLCGHHRIVPALYKLEGVTKEGDCAQRISQVTEIWKGRYNDEVVALKVLRVPRDDPHVQRTKSVSMSHDP